jgi:hypothetical protein
MCIGFAPITFYDSKAVFVQPAYPITVSATTRYQLRVAVCAEVSKHFRAVIESVALNVIKD